MKSPKNTLTIEDTSNVMEKFNKYNETQKNKSNIRNSLNLDTSFNSSLDYDIGNNLSQNNKINSERRSPRLEENSKMIIAIQTWVETPKNILQAIIKKFAKI